MSYFVIDKDKCRRDGICVDECPLRLLTIEDVSSVPSPVEGAEQMCIKCGHCVSVCPNGAFSLADMKPDDCPPVKKDMVLSIEQVEHFLRSRRSIRTYQEKEIEREAMRKLIDIARYAQTGKNSQLIDWLVIHSGAEVKKMASMTIEWMRHLIKEDHPVASSFGLRGVVKAWDSGYDIICRGAPGLVVAHAPKEYAAAQVDSAIALTFLDLAAPSFGLGTCWAGYFMMAASHWPPLQDALVLTEGHACFGAMMIGYPKYRYHRLPLRREPNIVWKGKKID